MLKQNSLASVGGTALMRDYKIELENRVYFIRNLLARTGAKGIVYGNSGGKDSTLTGILCKTACENTVGVIMPCQSKRNFNEDMEDARAIAKQYHIKTLTVDLTKAKEVLCDNISPLLRTTSQAKSNIAPRLRMTTLYTIAQSLDGLVCGTGNYSERYMGYFTKWGDGGYDFNPIADLTVTEVYEFLEYLHVPQRIIKKAPSAGLFDGQTDEEELGITYSQLDDYILKNNGSSVTISRIAVAHKKTEHKRKMPISYGF
jgi:NAD+ synthase